MEAVSKGAAVEGGIVEGVIVPKVFPNRLDKGNDYLSTVRTLLTVQEVHNMLTKYL